MACLICRRRKLKCDDARPSCATCVRLRKDCEYIEHTMRRGPKKRNVRALETRIASLEAQLNSAPRNTQVADGDTNFASQALSQHVHIAGESIPSDNDQFPVDMSGEYTPNDDLQMSFALDPILDSLQADSHVSSGTGSPINNIWNTQLISLGRHEQLPNSAVIEDLTSIFFQEVYSFVPIIHQGRFHMNMDFNSPRKPTLCLQYAMWTLAAMRTPRYSHLAEIFYLRSRKYLEEDEMSGQGSKIMTLSYVQCWGLIATYESSMAITARAWMSNKRAIALAQMLGLHAIDRPNKAAFHLLPDPLDFAEQEERRRTFWSVFQSDRWASAGSGHPMSIDEKDILTNLPSSEEAFLFNIEEQTQSLSDALKNGLSSIASPYAAAMVLSCLLGRSMLHSSAAVSHDVQDSSENQAFWTKHRQLDNLISTVFLSTPEHLRVSGSGTNNPLIWHFNVWLHALNITLHQTAMDYATRCNDSQSWTSRSMKRCERAADEIMELMRSISHLDPRKINPWASSCLYMASTVFVQKHKCGTWSDSNYEDLQFLLGSMRLLRNHSKIPDLFIKVLMKDIQKAGIRGFGTTDMPDDAAMLLASNAEEVTGDPLIGMIFSGVLPTE